MSSSLCFLCLLLGAMKVYSWNTGVHRHISRSLTRSRSLSSSPKQRELDLSFTETLRVQVKSLPMNVYVDPEIRSALSMKNHTRKTRIIYSSPESSISTMESLRKAIESKIPELDHKPYDIRVYVPEVRAKFSLALTPERPKDNDHIHASMIRAATTGNTLQVLVEPVPGVFPIQPDTAGYLLEMPNPLDTDTYSMVSFFRFHHHHVDHIPDLSASLEKLWKPFRAVGRVYLAEEGINAQMAIPTNVLSQFKLACDHVPWLRDLYLNVDHVMDVDSFRAIKPFPALHIRQKSQIVACDLEGEEALDVTSKPNPELSPLDWHFALDNPQAIVLDCRNKYESDVGKFDKAIPLDTLSFRESWTALQTRLEGVSRDAPVLTYCTGGIRCVKINAYLQQRMGFTNVHSLKGGIISYINAIASNSTRSSTNTTSSSNDSMSSSSDTTTSSNDSSSSSSSSSSNSSSMFPHQTRRVPLSRFRGVNYVFDDRMGSSVTDDVLGACQTCGQPTSSLTNCKQLSCHMRMTQCAVCSVKYSGCCCEACLDLYSQQKIKQETELKTLQELQKKSSKFKPRLLPLEEKNFGIHGRDEKKKKEVEEEEGRAVDDPLQRLYKQHAADSLGHGQAAMEAYCERYSQKEPEILAELRAETEAVFPRATRMICSPLQGRFLSWLVAMSKSTRVLELGSFTGYSAICLAEALLQSSSIDSSVRGVVGSNSGFLISCDSDPKAVEIARNFSVRSGLSSVIDFRLIKADDLLHSLKEEKKKFDFVFIDADKKSYQKYVRTLLENELLIPGATIVMDNTLWKGLVLQQESDLAEFAPEPAEFGDEKRMKAVSDSMHNFNQFVASHPSLQTVLLPFRDGFTAIRYIGNA